jgi:glycosyltransferase involved in cell wall biosynthesis
MNILRDKEELKETYEQKLTELLKHGLVLLYQPVKPEYMPTFYRAMDAIVLPSRLLINASSDRAPNVALEALASSNILIASYTGGIPAIIDNAAIVVKPNDPYALAHQIQEVLVNYEKYEYIRTRARERAIHVLDIRHYLYSVFRAVQNLHEKDVKNGEMTE